MADGARPPGDLRSIETLLSIMARLRSPEGGCPWDLEQSFRTIAPYTIEEAYEVADAIERGAHEELKDELGDLLFQVVFHARMAEEEKRFAFADVVEAICAKMIRRHPHVFAAEDGRTAEDQTAAWEEMKAAERAEKGRKSVLDDVPAGLPGLTRAVKLGKRAARVGFDWGAAADVLDKVEEESRELAEAADRGDAAEMEEEFGDLLFNMANLARKLKLDPEAALRRANEKFRTRFAYIEEKLGARLGEATLEDMDAFWNEAKAQEMK